MIPWILTLVLAFGGLGSVPNVTLPPVNFNVVSPARGELAGSTYFGPFQIGSNLYAVLIQELVTNFVCVYKSTDNGSSWTDMDAANRRNSNVYKQCDVALVGAVLHIFFVSAGQSLVHLTFDTGTDTFGAASTGPQGDHPRVAQFANGDFCVGYMAQAPTQPGLLVFASGVWGGTTLIPNHSGVGGTNNVNGLVIGVDDVARLVYYDTKAPGLNVSFRTFTKAGVLGGEQSIFSSSFVANTGAPISEAFDMLPLGRTVIWNNNLIVPYYGNPAGSGMQAGIYVGTPYTAPVWTFTLADTSTWAGTVADAYAYALVDSSNNLVLFWITYDVANNISRVYYAVNTGSGFGAPVFFYDQIGNAPSVGSFRLPVHSLSATRLATGMFGVITAIDNTVTLACTGFYLIDSGVPAIAGASATGGAGGPRIISKRCQIEAPPECPSVDLPYSLVYTKALAGNTILLDEKQIVGAQWFLLKAISGKSSAPYFVRFTRPDGLEMSNARVHTGVYLNLAGQRLLVDPPILMPADTWIGIELENQSSAVIAAIITFEGVQRRFFFDEPV